MKNLSKKIFIYILCAVLSVSTCSSCYFRSVYAFEYVGGALAFEEALKWLLGAIGIVSVGGMTADYWENHAEDFEDYCAQQNITNAEVAQWELKLCEGVLDKASSCWTAFKGWASSLISGSGSSSTGGVALGLSAYDTMNALISYYNSSMGFYFDSSSLQSMVVDGYCVTLKNGSLHMVHLFSGTSTLTWNDSSHTGFHIDGSGLRAYKVSQSATSFRVATNTNANLSRDSGNVYVIKGIDTSITDVVDLENLGGGAVTGDDTLDGLDGVDTENLDIINSDTVDEEDTEVAIPMPGLGASDDTLSADTYDDIIDAINQGLISLDDGIAQIHDLLHLLVYDDTTDEVIPFQPDPDSGENKTKDEVIQENKDNMGFTLFGLENVFPFCIPWDIVAFINVLKAPPAAPVFNLPFPNVNDLNHPLFIRVDLSDWDDAMEIFRLAEDFLFIIGLAFVTRSLIGAGGAD